MLAENGVLGCLQSLYQLTMKSLLNSCFCDQCIFIFWIAQY